MIICFSETPIIFDRDHVIELINEKRKEKSKDFYATKVLGDERMRLL